MFCSSLRKRPEWAAVIPAFLRTEPRSWKECNLETHDVAIPLSESREGDNVLFRFVLLTGADVRSPNAWHRIERLYGLDGGRNCAVVLLLQAREDEHVMTSYMGLQASMVGKFTMPVIPLTSADDLQGTLLTFNTRIGTARPPPLACTLTSAPSSLLRHCVIGEPLSSHASNVLSDINSCFSDLLDKTVQPEGQMMLHDYVGEDANRVIQFWLGNDAAY